jgi:hypothetical protein
LVFYQNPNFQHLLALLGGAVLGLAPALAHGQSVTFAGVQSVVVSNPNNFYGPLSIPDSVAVDAAGNLFIHNSYESGVVEFPKTASGYGPGIYIYSSDATYAPSLSSEIAVDSAEDVFIGENINDSYKTYGVEVPWTGTGYGSAITLPVASGDIAVDSTGNLFVTEYVKGGYGVIDYPKTDNGYGTPITLLTDIAVGPGFTLDGAGDLFLTAVDYSVPSSPTFSIVELPKTPTGYGSPITLPTSGLNYPAGIAVDGAGNVYIADTNNDRVVELPKTQTGYGSLGTLASHVGDATGVAVDTADNLYVTENRGNKVLKLQLQTPVTFGQAYACASGQTKPAPCSQTLTLSFGINADVTLGTPQVVSFDTLNPDFTLTSGGGCTGSYIADAICSVTVTFAPKAAGTRNGVVEIVDSKGNLLTSTPITGLGISTTDVPQAQVTPSLQFGTLPYGSSSAPLPVTVTNIGGQTLDVISASINAKSFTIVGNTCTTGLTSGQSCTLEVEFDPVNVAAFDNTLTIQTNGSSSTSTVTLEAIASSITVTGAPLEFGSVPYGSKRVLYLTVGNHWLPGTVTVQTTTSGPSYTVLQSSQNTCQAGIVSGGTCTLPVQFTPNGVGAHYGVLTLTPIGGGAPVTVSLDAWASGIIAGTQYLQFGTIPLGSTAVLPLTVTNDGLPGTVMVGVTASGPSYTVLNDAGTTCQAGISSGQSCTLLIQFSPVGAGEHNGILTLTPSSGASAVTIAIKGAATAP